MDCSVSKFKFKDPLINTLVKEHVARFSICRRLDLLKYSKNTQDAMCNET